MARVRFDGIYIQTRHPQELDDYDFRLQDKVVSPKWGARHFRFYEDGVAVMANISWDEPLPDHARAIMDWFSREKNEDGSYFSGVYKKRWNKIQFVGRSARETRSYVGIVKSDRLRLACWDSRGPGQATPAGLSPEGFMKRFVYEKEALEDFLFTPFSGG